METLALIETLDRDGQPRQVLRVSQWPVRIGRAIDCDLVLDDPHVAAHHATLALREDGVHVEPAASVNGVRLGRAAIAPGSTPLLPASSVMTLGATSRWNSIGTRTTCVANAAPVPTSNSTRETSA